MVIFCDFDGTITTEDVIDKFLENFASKEYLDIEQLWVNGVIGSRECLRRQLKTVRRINELEIRKFLEAIKIDPYFVDFYRFIKLRSWKLCIVSDGFGLFIRTILKSYNIIPHEIICSELEITPKGRLIPSFPYARSDCESMNATCKCHAVFSRQNELEDSIYIGDGGSDLCVAKKMDRVFAKGKLLKALTRSSSEVYHFEHFGHILQILNTRGAAINVQ